MSEKSEDKENMKLLESWLDKTSEILLTEADNLTEDIVNIIARKQEEYSELGFRKETIQTQMNRFRNKILLNYILRQELKKCRSLSVFLFCPSFSRVERV